MPGYVLFGWHVRHHHRRSDEMLNTVTRSLLASALSDENERSRHREP